MIRISGVEAEPVDRPQPRLHPGQTAGAEPGPRRRGEREPGAAQHERAGALGELAQVRAPFPAGLRRRVLAQHGVHHQVDEVVLTWWWRVRARPG